MIPVRNGATRLAPCLASVLADNYPADRREILVADNGSTDSSAQVAAEAGCRVISLPGLRVAAVRNLAAQAARGEVLAFVDADHRIDSGWTRSAVAALGRPGVVAAGAPYHAPRHGTWVQRMYDAFRDHRTGSPDAEWLGAGNLAVKRGAFLEAGGFDESLVTCEDVDLCERLRTAGGRILNVPRMRTVHYGDPSTLKALFVGELWRGRDNLRASLRAKLSWRGLPSILIPVADLGLMALALAGLLTLRAGGAPVVIVALTGMLLFAGLRATAMLCRLERASVADAARALAVALTYDVARALAPLWRGSHGARRRAEAR